jgi:O-antigen ligase
MKSKKPSNSTSSQLPMQRTAIRQPLVWNTFSLQGVTHVALLAFVCAVTLSISAMQAAYTFALGAVLLEVCQQRTFRQLRFPLIIPIGGFALASLLATLTAVDPYHSLVELRNILEIAVFYLAVNAIRSERHATTLINTLIAAGAVMALYGLSQAVASGAAFRISGTSNYMTFAGQLMLIITMTLAQLLFNATRWRNRWHIYWMIPALLVCTAALLNTHTRNAWLGFAVSCMVLFILRRPRLVLVLPVLALLAFFVSPDSVQNRIRSLWNLQDVTIQERLSMWRSGLHMTRDHLWTGVGMGSMPKMYQRYREAQSPIAPERHLSHLHNNAVQIAAERGVIGLACWAAIWVAFFYQGWQVYRGLSPPLSQSRALVVGSLASVAGFLVSGGFEHNFGDSEVITLVYFLMALPFVIRRVQTPGL